MTTESTSPPESRTVSPVPQPRPLHWWLRKLGSAGLTLLVGVLFIVAIGLAQRWGWIRPESASASSVTATNSGQIYTCPMHPQIRQPQPGRCPICGMELVSASGGPTDLNEFSIKIEPAQRRLANIQTAPVERVHVVAELQSIGSIAIDESRMATISSYIAGRIERLFADYTGVDVAKGDHLANIYSPQIYSAQIEYLEARKSLSAMTSNALEIVRQTQQKLVESARHRLVESGMTTEQITKIEQSGDAQSRLTIYAPMGGTVTQKLLVEGEYVSAGEPIYRIANLTTVWLMLELFPEDASRIRFGQKVIAEVQSLPGQTFQGRVAFIDPTVDPKNRTVGVRVEFLNEDRRLRPGDYATATVSLPIGPEGDVYDENLAGRWISPMHPQIIRDEPGQCPICGMDLVPTTRFGYSSVPLPQPTSLVVPRSAVLLAGDSSVVYVEVEPGRFEIRVVTLGSILRNRAIIIDGVKEGELVATAGNFLIDSQMQLAGKPSLIDPSRASVKQQERTKPLEFESIKSRPVAGETGSQLEELYAAYIRIQQTLSNDQPPAEEDARRLHKLATALSESDVLGAAEQQRLKEIATRSEHLHHLPLDQARMQAFRPISHAVVSLAASIRGADSDQPLYHMVCSMVKGGGGDWLQSSSPPRNPYMGSKMLECGEVAHEFASPKVSATVPEEPPPVSTPRQED